MVYRSKQSAVCGRCLHVLVLFGCHAYVTLLLRRDFSLSWPRDCSVLAPVEADACVRGVLIDHRCVVDVVDYRRIYICDRAVIEIFATLPVASKEAHTGIPETIVNPAVKANGRSPISRVPNVKVVLESPVSGRPEKSYFRWEDPRSWNPEVAAIAVRPIARHPDVAWLRTDRLHIHRQDRRHNADGNDYAHVSACFCLHWRRSKQKGTSEYQRTEQTGETHKTHLSGVGWACCVSLAQSVARGMRL
jgi:hypothetical protein